MMGQFSLPIRRFLAIGLLVLVILIFIFSIAIPIFDRMNVSREALLESRYRLAKLKIIEKEPAVKSGANVSSDALLQVKNAKQAQAALAAHLTQVATLSNISVPSMQQSARQANTSSVATNFSTTGNEPEIMGFIYALETGQPLVRLRQWSIVPIEDQPGQVTLSATAVSAWRKI